MRARWKEVIAAIAVVGLFVVAYLSLRSGSLPNEQPPLPVPEQAVQQTTLQTTATPVGDTITQDQAVEIAKTFCQAVRWNPEGDLKIEFRPDDGTYGPAWDVTWLRAPLHDREWTVGVHAETGQILRTMDYYQGHTRRAASGAPALSDDNLIQAASSFAQAAGLSHDPTKATLQLSPTRPDNWSDEEPVVVFARCFGDAAYKDDAMTVWLHPDTRQVTGMSYRARMQPPPDVPRNISQKEAIELGKKYLTDPTIMGSSTLKIHGVNKMDLMVVPPSPVPKSGYGHAGEPSRIAWVVEYSRLEERPGRSVDTSHVVEAWIDAEDGSLLGTQRCK